MDIDTIELNLPLKPDYVSVARLTTAGILNRMNSDIDTIEDVKVAVSEVCTQLINLGSQKESNFIVIFNIKGNNLNIFFKCKDSGMKCIFNGDNLALSLINALMDDVQLCAEEDYILSFSKSV